MTSSVMTSSSPISLASNRASPMSPTFMPYLRRRSPSVSSLNTRQRCDFEDDPTMYPGLEMPFASEPALESEQDPQLPVLKRLKSNGAGEEGGSVVCAKGILACRRSTFDDPCKESTMSGPPLPPLDLHFSSRPTLQPSWSVSPVHMTQSEASAFVTSLTASRPMSRRSSSGASSNCGSMKAVRFASGNGLGFSSVFTPSPANASPPSREDPFTHWEEHVQQASLDDPDGVYKREELAGPVAAIVYLTHSREAYDRSPIVVDEAGCKLPPRHKREGDRGWIKCGKRNVTPGCKAGGGETGEGVVAATSRSGNRKAGQNRMQQAETGASPLFRSIHLEQSTDHDEVAEAGCDRATTSCPSSSSEEGDHPTGTDYWNEVHPNKLDLATHFASAPVSTPPSSPTSRTANCLEAAAHSDDESVRCHAEQVTPAPGRGQLLSLFIPSTTSVPSSTSGSPRQAVHTPYPRSSDVSLDSTETLKSPLHLLKSTRNEVHDNTAHNIEVPSSKESSQRKDGDDDDGGDDDNDDDDDGVDDDEEGEGEEDEGVGDEDEEEKEVDEVEEADRKRRRKLGMCGLGKWSREDVFTFDALGGF